ncbi:hypothetical protein CN325_27500 [Bacillus thuringiensis]|uniref:hypothetical protein n=1 Tax=Bacillus thuringiensis TaxID=1428 RepID=UPI000BF5401D|nr:hypothetical protein [Bacillus thuringiensis]PFE90292.1 hypothetical protein CN325_27500 [Bacillus thuringiensis]
MMINRWIEKEDYQAAEKNGIGYNMLYRRVYQMGWNVDKAINTPPRKYQFREQKWLRIALENGVKKKTFLTRVYKGMSPEEAAKKPVKKLRATMEDMVNLAEENGISYSTFSKRVLKGGWSPQRAATTPIRRPKKKSS